MSNATTQTSHLAAVQVAGWSCVLYGLVSSLVEPLHSAELVTLTQAFSGQTESPRPETLKQ